MRINKIIVEGPDCSGKSTFVERLKNMLHWDSKSLHHIDGNQFERYLKEYVLNKNLVFDRSHFSEIVYSKLWKRKTPFVKEEFEILNSLIGLDSLIVFVCPDFEVLEKRYNNRNFEQQIKFEELEKSRKLFIEIFEGIPVIIYKSKDYEELNSLLIKIKGMIK